ncbi:MAG: pyridoxamine 5'-phosphate oxidase family protein [Nitrospinota bacterium]
MGKFFESLKEEHVNFIKAQKVFFIGTASDKKGINISPKGVYSIKVLDKNRVAYLGLPGSGNRTAEDIAEGSGVTLMFCGFDEKPMIVRLFCKGETLKKGDDSFAKLAALWDGDSGKNPAERARDIFLLHVEKVHKSCGFGVPIYSYVGDKREASLLGK